MAVSSGAPTVVGRPPGDGDGVPGGPRPRRVGPPRWLDLRLVLGVLLVLGSVLVGARVLSAADATVPVWAAAADLAEGTVLTAEDLVPVPVRLDDVSGAYLASSTRPEGRVLARTVRAGELLPRSALAEPTGGVQLALPVQAAFVPPSLTRGQLVDVYAVADPVTGATGAGGGGVDLVVSAAPVQAVSGRGDGVLSTATTTVQVVVSVPADDAAGVLATIGGRGLVVVVRSDVDGGQSLDDVDTGGAGLVPGAPASSSPAPGGVPAGPTG